MSRFFQQASDSSEDSSSSSEEELYESSEEEQSSEEESSEEEDSEEDSDDDSDSDSESDSGKGKKASAFLKSKFLKGSHSDSDDDSDDESKRVVKSAKDKLLDEIDSCIKTIDNGKKINDWVAISSEFEKLNKNVERIMKQFNTTPKQYIKAIVELEAFAQEATKAQKSSKKKMNALNLKALNATTQKVKKNNKGYEKLIAQYNADSDAFMNESVEESSEDKPKVKGIKASFTASHSAGADDDSGFTTVGKAATTDTDAFSVLKSVVESRGRKGVDNEEQARLLESIYKETKEVYVKIVLLLRLIPLKLDIAAATPKESVEIWNSTKKYVDNLLDILDENFSKYQLSDSAPEPEELEKGLPPREDGVQEIPGSIVSIVERLDDEFTHSLVDIDPHTTEYVDRLRDESGLYAVILRTQIYLERTTKLKFEEYESISRILSRRVDRIYFKPNVVVIAGEKAAWSTIDSSLDSKISPRIPESVPEDYVTSLINGICSVLYQQSNLLFRTRAILCHIYNYALNDKYYKARDLMLMSHIQSSIATAEIPLQILYNRTLVQIGICAFRNGLIAECQQTLAESSASSRLKELLGQGVAKNINNSSTEGRQRLLPFHMHINLEFLECINLTSAMLIEVPSMVASEKQIDGKKKVISRTFRRMLDYNTRQVFTGPPENTRDHIMQAARALLECEWKKARDLLNSIKIWDLLPNPEDIKKMLGEKLQVEGLRTYLFRYGATYRSLSFATLSTLFDLSERRITVIISKMIANEEIDAALDQKTNSVIFRQGVELSRLQNLASALAEKAVQLVERNERLAGGQALPEQAPRTNANSNNASNTGSNHNNQNQSSSNSGRNNRSDGRRNQTRATARA